MGLARIWCLQSLSKSDHCRSLLYFVLCFITSGICQWLYSCLNIKVKPAFFFPKWDIAHLQCTVAKLAWSLPWRSGTHLKHGCVLVMHHVYDSRPASILWKWSGVIRGCINTHSPSPHLTEVWSSSNRKTYHNCRQPSMTTRSWSNIALLDISGMSLHI